MNDHDEASIGDGYTDDDPDAPECVCPDWDMRSERRFHPDCEIHPPLEES
jgi:hypothetical protein